MSDAVVALAVAGAYAIVCAGWGEMLARSVGLKRCGVAMDMALGIAALVMVGGVLNLLRAATWPFLFIVIVVGAAVCLRRAIVTVRTGPGLRLPDWRGAGGIAGILIAVFAVFIAATVIPPSAMNLDDDLKKYLAYLVRMVQTGTLSGNPLNGLGYESLGGQTFLQALVGAFVALPNIETFDTLFCLALSAWMAGTLTGSARELAAVSVLAAFTVLFMETQHVNVSANYSGTALILALYALLSDPGETSLAPRRAFAAGLIVAALVGLKLTFLPIAGMAVLAGAVSHRVATGSLGAPLTWAIYVSIGTMLGLAPWVGLYAPFIVEAFRDHVQADTPAVLFPEAMPLFSTEGRAWRASGLAFTTAAVITVVAAALPLSRWRRLDVRQRANAAALATAAFCMTASFFVVVVFGGAHLSGYDASIRYFAPMFAAAMPASVALGARYYSGHGSPGEYRRADSAFTFLVIAGLALFAPAFLNRVAQAALTGNLLAYAQATRSPYIERYQTLISPAHETATRELQEMVPAGAPLLLWTTAPFTFDFRRNEIYDVNMTGLASPWAHIPPLKYVIWEHSGFGVTTLPDLEATASRPGTATQRAAIHMLMLGELLTEAINDPARAAVLHDNGSVLVLRVEDLPREWRDRMAMSATVPP